ncbi:MAG: ATP-binding protein, partial [Alphaproteobacteria bacterium]|nr:ATP-binding protein [Alphaproteobacteria bacterium]
MAKTAKKQTSEQQNFSADVARLLEIVAGALYTNHDVFLRELISNAADACGKLRFEAIQNPALTKGDPDFRIHVFKNTDDRTVGVFDNGIGMSAEELADHLGTIAKSGSRALMEQVKASKGGDALKLIGQFGVGFYAAYMVASHVRVISRKAGTKDTNVWESDGSTGFTVRPA